MVDGHLDAFPCQGCVGEEAHTGPHVMQPPFREPAFVLGSPPMIRLTKPLLGAEVSPLIVPPGAELHMQVRLDPGTIAGHRFMDRPTMGIAIDQRLAKILCQFLPGLWRQFAG